MENNPANGIKDMMWKFLMDKGQKESIPELKASVYRLIQMTTQKTAGQRSKTTHIPWETLDMEIMRIVIEATALVLSGRLDELEEKQMAVNKDKLKELDSHWSEVMELAEKYGFIGQAFGGTAVLLTHKNQLEADGEEKYIRRQKDLFGLDMKVSE